MTSITDVANMTLDALKARAQVTITGSGTSLVSDGTLACDVIVRNFWARIDGLSRSAHWNCLRSDCFPTLIYARTGTPENPTGVKFAPPVWPWLYSYALPTGAGYSVTVAQDDPAVVPSPPSQAIAVPSAPAFLKARFIVPRLCNPTTSVPIMGGMTAALPIPISSNPPIPLSVASDLDYNGVQLRTLRTNASSPQLAYTCRVIDPTLWDSDFLDAAVMTLAAWCEQPIAGSMQLNQMLEQKASSIVARARITDGNEGPQWIDSVPDWLSARNPSGPGVSGGSFYGEQWDALSLPNGAF